MIQKYIRVNDRIRSPEVRVIGAEGEQLGVLMIRRALELAQQSELDLVEVAPTAKPPVCRIMDYSKYKYDQEKKERRIKKHQHVMHLKQIRVKPHIADSDYHVKLRQVIAFLDKKDKVKINMMFRGREMAHKELGEEILRKFITDTQSIGTPDKSPAMEGRVMYVILNPLAEKSNVHTTKNESGQSIRENSDAEVENK